MSDATLDSTSRGSSAGGLAIARARYVVEMPRPIARSGMELLIRCAKSSESPCRRLEEIQLYARLLYTIV